MAEILQLFSITRRLYQPDVIPLAQLQLESTLQRLKERYKFANTAIVPGIQLHASSGEFIPEGATSPVPVQQVVFALNTIESQVVGETNAADQFQSDLARFLGEISGGTRTFPEQARTAQTIAIAKLSVPLKAMFSEKMNSYIGRTAVPAFKLDDAQTHVQLLRLQWVVNYTRNSIDYAYEPKVFTIEPRAGTRLDEQIYFTQSPTDSVTHRRLLDQFEDMLR